MPGFSPFHVQAYLYNYISPTDRNDSGIAKPVKPPGEYHGTKIREKSAAYPVQDPFRQQQNLNFLMRR